MATDEVSSKEQPASGRPSRQRSATAGSTAAPRRRKRSADDVPASGAPASGADAAPSDAASAPWVGEDGAVIAADHVEVTFGAVGRVEARELDVDRGAVGAARAEHLFLERSALGAAMADEVEIHQGYARSILAREVRVDQSVARSIVAQEIHVERSSFVGILLAQRVVGEVKVLLDWRGALALGAAAGLVMRLLGRGRRTRG